MKNASITIQTVDQTFPLGTVGGQWYFKVEGVGPLTFVSEVVADEPKATFAALEAGSYLVTVSRLDADSFTLGDSISQPFDVEDDVQTVTISVAAGVTIEVL